MLVEGTEAESSHQKLPQIMETNNHPILNMNGIQMDPKKLVQNNWIRVCHYAVQ